MTATHAGHGPDGFEPTADDAERLLAVAFSDGASAGERRTAMTALGRIAGRDALSDRRVGAAARRGDGSLLVVCGPEDADTYGRGVLEALGPQEAVRFSCLWSSQRRPDGDALIDIAPVVRRYDEPVTGAPGIVVVARFWLARAEPVGNMVFDGRQRAGAEDGGVLLVAARAEDAAVRDLTEGHGASLPRADVLALSRGDGVPRGFAAQFDAERAFQAGIGLPDGGCVTLTPALVAERVPGRLRLMEALAAGAARA